MSLVLLNGTWSWNMSLSVGFAFLGMICICLAFWPGFYNTWKTKDTKFLPIKLFSLFLLTGVLMTAGSISGIWEKPSSTSFYIRGWIFVLLNAFVMSTNLYTVGLWCKNKIKEKIKEKMSGGYTDIHETSEAQEEHHEFSEESQEDQDLLNLGMAV